ncbi:hypothetical protein PIB30_059884 [Stylosanthes scabra]|uniref:Uncharacterized protein n=1 Tax=Stylosanthes scabra TaxID=79078 RepID=A0ABU6VNH4_9FABA|nr:hypothetical protein [Stylosanthes scabra]
MATGNDQVSVTSSSLEAFRHGHRNEEDEDFDCGLLVWFSVIGISEAIGLSLRKLNMIERLLHCAQLQIISIVT